MIRLSRFRGKLRQIAPENFRRTPRLLGRKGHLEAREFHASSLWTGGAAAETVQEGKRGVLQ